MLLGIAIAAPAWGLEKTVLQLRWDHSFQFAGYYAAQWNGYYGEEGLDVEIRGAIRPDGSLVSAINAVAEGRADFGIGAADILVARDRGKPLMVLAAIFQQSAVAFFALHGAGMRTPADLVRLRVSRRAGDMVDVEMEAMLMAEGINPARVDAYPFDQRKGYLAGIMAGDIDVVPGYIIGTPHEAKELGIVLDRLRPADYGVDFYGDSLFTRADMATRQPQVVDAFTRASLKGWQYALDHSDEIADRIIAEFTPRFPVADFPSFIRYQVAPVRELTHYPIVQLGNVNPKRWQRMHATLAELNLVHDRFSPLEFIYDPEAREHAEYLRLKRILTVTAIVVAGLTGLILMWLFTLRRTVLARTRELSESEARHRLLAEHATDMISRHDPDGIYTYASNACLRITGYAPKELIGRHAYDFFHPDDIEQVRVSHKTILEKSIVYAVAYRLRHKQGRYVWVETTSKTIRDPKTGRVLEIICVTRDITERRREETRLRSAYVRLEALWGVGSLAVTDEKSVSDHVLASITRMTESRYGFYGFMDPKGSEMAIHSWSTDAMKDCGIGTHPRLFPIDGAGVWGEAVRRGKPFMMNDYNAGHRAKKGLPEGHVALTNLLVVPFFRRGRIISLAAVANKETDYEGDDIRQIESFLNGIQALIEKRHAEAALRENERKYRTLFENMRQGVFYQRSDGAFIDVNPAALDLFGLTYDEFLGRTSTDPNWRVVEEDGTPIPPEGHPSMVALRTGRAVADRIVGVFNPRKKSHVWLNVNAVPQFRSGESKPWQVFVTLHDITDRKRAEEERRILEKQLSNARKMEALGTLSGGIAHEFNNILAVIMGNAELALDTFEFWHPAREHMQEILTASQRAREVVRRILHFISKLPSRKTPIRIASVVAESLEMMRSLIPDTIEIRRRISCRDEMILANPDEINQIIDNLFRNAVQAMKNGGVLTVGLEPWPCGPSPDTTEGLGHGACVRLSVEDNGAGIDPNIMDRIFEPYFTTKSVNEGLGMGLAVVYGIVKTCKGEIAIRSRLGQGTTVEILFPLLTETAPPLE